MESLPDSQKHDKVIIPLLIFIALAVLAVVVLLYTLPKKEEVPGFVRFLPKYNATINAICSLLLISSFIAVKKARYILHKKLNLLAFFLSSTFLISYVIFHYFGIETKFPADNPVRPFYLTILISHIVLAAFVLPFVLISLYRGLSGNFLKHKKISRITLPLWLYVTISGVIVYLMISPYYTF